MVEIGRLGRDEGKITGPRPGDGASSVGGMVAGGTDMEGTPGDELPPRPGYETAGPDARGVTHPTDPGTHSVGRLADGTNQLKLWLAVAGVVALSLLALWLLGVITF